MEYLRVLNRTLKLITLRVFNAMPKLLKKLINFKLTQKDEPLKVGNNLSTGDWSLILNVLLV